MRHTEPRGQLPQRNIVIFSLGNEGRKKGGLSAVVEADGRGLVGLAGVPGLTEALDVLIGTLKKVEVRLLRSRKRHEIVSWQFAGH